MNILFLATWYPNHLDSMLGLFVRRHAEAVAFTHKVSVVHVVRDEKAAKIFSVIQRHDDQLTEIAVIYRPLCFKVPLLASFFSFFQYICSAFYGIRKAFKTQGKPDIIHVHVLTRMGLPALWFKLFYGIPYIITEHWSRYQKITGNYKGWLRKLITPVVVKQASALTTVTKNLLKAMNEQGLYNSNSYVLPNVADEAFFTHPVRETSKSDSQTIIVHLSCFEDRSKNISAILRVFSKLCNLRNDVRLIMIGDGVDFESMKNYSLTLGLTERQICFTGLLSAEEIAPVFSQSSYLLMFSNYENLPVVINEAFASGLPVISSDVGGISEVLLPDCGFLVPAGNEDKLLETLLNHLDTTDQFDANALRERAITNFSLASVNRQLTEIYNKVHSHV